MSQLRAAHSEDGSKTGIDVITGEVSVVELPSLLFVKMIAISATLEVIQPSHNLIDGASLMPSTQLLYMGPDVT